MPYDVLTDRDERELLLRTEDRISRPLPVRAALAAVGGFLARRPRAGGKGRESLSCQPKQNTTPTGPLTR